MRSLGTRMASFEILGTKHRTRVSGCHHWVLEIIEVKLTGVNRNFLATALTMSAQRDSRSEIAMNYTNKSCVRACARRCSFSPLPLRPTFEFLEIYKDLWFLLAETSIATIAFIHVPFLCFLPPSVCVCVWSLLKKPCLWNLLEWKHHLGNLWLQILVFNCRNE